MKRLRVALAVVVALVVLFSASLALAQKTVHVKGYTRKDGTVVKPYDRKAPTTHGAAATTPPPASTAAANQTASQDPKKQAPDENGDTIVYITKTGAKYHRAGCRSLAKSSIPIKLRDAVAKGYGACKVCKPPELIAKKQDGH